MQPGLPVPPRATRYVRPRPCARHRESFRNIIVSEDRQKREHELALLLEYLHRKRGLDLSGYKRVGLLRRLTKRMRSVGIEGYGEYITYLESHPGEYTGLLDTLLINVTAFFRDDLPWEYLRTDIVPAIVEHKAPTDSIRVWCAGCASGEEAYTLAMVIAEVIGIEAFQERVKLYGTDLDNDALAKARLGAYSERRSGGGAGAAASRSTSSAAIRTSCSGRISGAA